MNESIQDNKSEIQRFNILMIYLLEKSSQKLVETSLLDWSIIS